MGRGYPRVIGGVWGYRDFFLDFWGDVAPLTAWEGWRYEHGTEDGNGDGNSATRHGARGTAVINDAGTGVDAGGRIQVVEFNHDVYRLPTLNQMFGSHFHARGKVKKAVELALSRLFRVKLVRVVGYPVNFHFLWRNRTRRVDPDNQAGAGQKLILDALQKAGVMENDGTYHVGRLYHDFEYGVQNSSLVVEMRESMYNEDRLRSVGKGDGDGMILRKRALNGRKKKAVTQPVMQLELWDDEG
jgi:hypothetical protein